MSSTASAMPNPKQTLLDWIGRYSARVIPIPVVADALPTIPHAELSELLVEVAREGIIRRAYIVKDPTTDTYLNTPYRTLDDIPQLLNTPLQVQFRLDDAQVEPAYEKPA